MGLGLFHLHFFHLFILFIMFINRRKINSSYLINQNVPGSLSGDNKLLFFYCTDLGSDSSLLAIEKRLPNLTLISTNQLPNNAVVLGLTTLDLLID